LTHHFFIKTFAPSVFATPNAYNLSSSHHSTTKTVESCWSCKKNDNSQSRPVPTFFFSIGHYHTPPLLYSWSENCLNLRTWDFGLHCTTSFIFRQTNDYYHNSEIVRPCTWFLYCVIVESNNTNQPTILSNCLNHHNSHAAAAACLKKKTFHFICVLHISRKKYVIISFSD